MKAIRIRGGLGNQLFGLAFAHSVATLAGGPVALDVSGFARDRYGNAFMLDDLAARLGFQIGRHPIFGSRLVGAAMGALAGTFWVGEAATPPDREGLTAMARRGRYFDGYWQNEAYIAEPQGVREALRTFLEERGGPTERHDILIHYRTYADEIRPERRGTPGADYFEHAIERVEATGGVAADIGLVSDNLDLAMQRLGAAARRVTPLAGGGVFGDMALMLKARSLILGNSSFSWWGGFCGDAEYVIFPRRDGVYHYPAPASRFILI